MLKLIGKIQVALIIIALFASCDGSKKTTETSDANQSRTDAKEQKMQDSDAASTAKTSQDQQMDTQTISGQEIMDRMMNRLETKLTLNDDQSKQVRNLMTGAFKENGNDLAGKYTMSDAKNIFHDLLAKQQDAVSKMLNDKQQAIYTELIKR